MLKERHTSAAKSFALDLRSERLTKLGRLGSVPFLSELKCFLWL